MILDICNFYEAKVNGISELEHRISIYKDEKKYEELMAENDGFYKNNPIEFIESIAKVVKLVVEKYHALKAEKNLVDFNDIEHMFYKILTLFPQCIQDIKYLFVDEYQDINPMQESIISIFEKYSECVFAGDYKQSIYSFRHTNPIFFLNKFNKYKRLSLNNNDYLSVSFNENWRSGN